MRFIVVFIFAFLCSISLFAQSRDDIKREKNKIRRDDGYLSIEVQDSTKVAAEKYAYIELLAQINNFRIEQKKDSVPEGILQSLVKVLSYQRESSLDYVSFAYIKKEDVLSPDNNYTNDTLNSSSMDNNAALQSNSSSTSFVPIISSSSKNQIFLSLSTMEMMTEIERTLIEYQQEGIVQEYGRLNAMTALQENVHLVIFSRDVVTGAAVERAILQSQGAGKYMNVATSQPDSLHNYKGCSALWFRLK